MCFYQAPQVMWIVNKVNAKKSVKLEKSILVRLGSSASRTKSNRSLKMFEHHLRFNWAE
jgi:hypothetical protein